MVGKHTRKADATPVACAGLDPQLPPRERIMLTARELFYRHGIHPVGVEAIAEAALTNKMTLYRHFRSKDDLVVAYVSQLADEGDELWQRLSEAHRGDPKAMLEGWISYVQDVLENRFERGCALANAAIELAPGHPARTVIEAYKQRKRENLVRLFAQLCYHDPELLADEVFLLFEGARISLQCGGKAPASRVVQLLRDLLARSATKKPRGRAT